MPGGLFTDDFRLQWSEGDAILDSTDSLMGGPTLHGGAIAAFGLLCARGGSEPGAAPPSAVACHVNYMRAGRGQSFKARVSSSRQVRELAFHDLIIRDERDEPIASVQIALTVGGGGAAGPANAWATPAGNGSEFEQANRAIPFLRDRGVKVIGVDEGALEMSFQLVPRNLDFDGSLHEGAMLALIDCIGATVPFTLTRSRSLGATLALSAHFTGIRPASTVSARARIRQLVGQYSWADIDLVDAEAQHCGFATVLYRLPDPRRVGD